MVVLKGKSVFGDICMGELFFYRRGESVIKRHKIDDADAETARFKKAKEEAKEQLLKLYEKALHEVGEDNAAIFEIHRMMLDDEDYCESVENIIRSQLVNAEYAVGVTADNFAEMFSSMDDAYMQARAADVRDISERIVKILSGADALGSGGLSSPAIIAADDLAPSETVQLDRSKVLGFVMQNGSANSHTAILGRSMGIPSVIGVGEGLSAEHDGKFAIVDGFDGVVYIDPDAETVSKLEQKRRNASRRKELLQELKASGYKFKGRMREIVADMLNVSPAQMGRMESINKNLSPEFTEEFKGGNIGITTAYELSTLPKEKQAAAMEEYKAAGAEAVKDVKKRVQNNAVKPSAPPPSSEPPKTSTEQPRQEAEEAKPPKRKIDRNETIRLLRAIAQDIKGGNDGSSFDIYSVCMDAASLLEGEA